MQYNMDFYEKHKLAFIMLKKYYNTLDGGNGRVIDQMNVEANCFYNDRWFDSLTEEKYNQIISDISIKQINPLYIKNNMEKRSCNHHNIYTNIFYIFSSYYPKLTAESHDIKNDNKIFFQENSITTTKIIKRNRIILYYMLNRYPEEEEKIIQAASETLFKFYGGFIPMFDRLIPTEKLKTLSIQ